MSHPPLDPTGLDPMTNTSDTAREQFEIVRRGYEPQQVDRTV